MEQKLSDTLVKAIDRSNPMMQNLQLASRFNKLIDKGGSSVTVEALNVTENGTYTAPSGKAYSPVTVNVPSGEDTTGFSVQCSVLSDGYITCVVFPRSAKVTAVTKTESVIVAGGTQKGFAVFGSVVDTDTKISVVYDGDTYSYTYTSRDYEQHDLVKE